MPVNILDVLFLDVLQSSEKTNLISPQKNPQKEME